MSDEENPVHEENPLHEETPLHEENPVDGETPKAPSHGRESRRRRLFRVTTAPPTFGGLILAIVFWWESLAPTLMPRTALIQGAISGICLAAGYALGTLAGRMIRVVLRRADKIVPTRWWRVLYVVVAAAATLGVAVGLPMWLSWQNDQRDLLSMDHLGVLVIVPMVLIALAVCAILSVAGRLIGATVRKLNRWSNRHLPRPAAVGLTAVIVMVVSVFTVRNLAFTRFVAWADTTYSDADRQLPEGVDVPTSKNVSGSPDSLISWDSLGARGREFVGSATTSTKMEEFWGSNGGFIDPVRIYAGRSADSAGSAEDRAALAVRDLERAGGFDRKVLVVATTTGTGWIDPDAARTLEIMYRGDSAIVAMQYSLLPSWISFITDLDAASEAGVELNNAVYEYWSELPETERPKLIVYGLSLGSYGAEAAFRGVDAQTSILNFTTRSDGALLVGPTGFNWIHRQLLDERDKGSSHWWPRFDDGRTVRFQTRDPDQPTIGTPWKGARVLYIQHPSDPVTQWGFDWIWSPTVWNDRPRGYDVPQQGSWFPIVTFVQGVFDMMVSFDAPPGHGHDYRLDYVSGWSKVVPPSGWTDNDANRLQKKLFDK